MPGIAASAASHEHPTAVFPGDRWSAGGKPGKPQPLPDTLFLAVGKSHLIRKEDTHKIYKYCLFCLIRVYSCLGFVPITSVVLYLQSIYGLDVFSPAAPISAMIAVLLIQQFVRRQSPPR